jgi:predicted murein hydrolase (TIGR00659 family)
MWLLVTVIVFLIGRWCSQKLHTPLANPLLISVAILIGILIYCNIPYKIYANDTQFVNFLLQPAVVALAYPLYEQLPQIRRHWKLILLACTCGSMLSMLTTSLIAVSLHTDIPLIAALLSKSVTTPIAMEVTRQLGGEPAIAAILVLIVGLFGAIFAYPAYRILNIHHPVAKGLTMGTISHALGTATCVEKAHQDAAFSSLALVLCGIITSILSPVFFYFSVWLYHFMYA